MALDLVFSDSFDHYDLARIDKKWDAVNIGQVPGSSMVTGRNGQAFRVGGIFNNLTKIVSLPATDAGTFITVLTTFRLESLPVAPIVRFTAEGPNRSDHLCEVLVSGDSTIRLETINGTVGRMTRALHPGVWYMLQVGVTLQTFPTDPPSMVVTAKAIIDEPVGHESGLFSAVSVVAVDATTFVGFYINRVSLFADGGDYDDFSIFIDLEPADLTLDNILIPFYDQRVLMRVPTGDGARQDFVPASVGAHYVQVDENPPDDDASYVASPTFGDKDTYTYPAVPAIGAAGAILGVQNTIDARAATLGDGASGFDAVAGLLRVSATDHEHRQKNLTASYRFCCFPTTRNPDTGDLFTLSELNAAEFGAAHEDYYKG